MKNYAPWPEELTPAWKARAAQAIKESRAALDRIPPENRDPGDPNSPVNDGIFGYDRRGFLEKQYRPRRLKA